MSSPTSTPDFGRGIDGLLPAIAQDSETGEVLMMAWMNREVWEETLHTGRVVYWSRSRQSPWRKGETSGHVQRLVSARVDCDADAILLQVTQQGAACHEGYRSCFFREIRPQGEVAVISERLVDPQAVYGRPNGLST
jgi:phosphoribosyl-AMP cyclohydrolase